MDSLSSRFEAAADALATAGWCVLPRLLPDEITAALAHECAAMHAARRMTPARVGGERTATPLRNDHTRWFEMNALSEAQLPLVEALAGHPAMRQYHLLPTVRGDLLEKLGRHEEARAAFAQAAALARNAREKALLEARAASL